ncbi:Leucine-rich repeat-containing protein [Cynara cardunculus var. scolymus]|uniref:Leucine-rich repeat-containing protein n=1 Tax=Cynara cardunculus var. scolymus TaxID=59895 RepID=A0A103Y842_CYNCS|nr:Leucine-rich repeat-containing protein [Cynara cardunculus var. scolymus]
MQQICSRRKVQNLFELNLMKMILEVLLVVMFIGPAMSQLPSQDILALLEFKKGIKHDPTAFVLSSWNEESIDFNGCPSSWNGIMCNGGNVAGVSLKNLSLAGNNFTGPIPDWISGLNSIQSLDLSRNSFSGPIPPSLTHLNNLVYLNLSENGFMKKIPSGFQDMVALEVLDLHGNMFDGDFDAQFLLLTTAIHVDFSGNLLVSSSSQQEKFLAGISDTVKYLNLSRNQLTGSLVTGGVAQMFGSVVLKLSNNRFSGFIPNDLLRGDSLNQLTGSIPEVIAQFLRLNHLNLSHNSLDSAIPKAITMFPRLSVLDLGFNRFGGPFPNGLISMPTLQELHLPNNELVGSVDLFSSSFSNDSNIRVLDISDNQLDGDFPDGFGLLTGLQVLDVSGNNFSGSLPPSLGGLSDLVSLDISQNHFTGPLLKNLTDDLKSFNASYNDLSGVVPENLRKFPESAFFPGNSDLQFPNPPPGPNPSASSNKKKPIKTIFKVLVIVACVIAVVILILLAVFIHYMRISRRPLPQEVGTKDVRRRQTAAGSGGGMVISAGDIMTSRKGSSSEMITPEKIGGGGAVASFSPSKTSGFSYSPDSGDSYTVENLSRLDVRSPDRLAGELYFLDDTVSFSPEELSRAPAEVLGRSSHGTSYRATLDNGLLLTVKWLREGVAKQRKDFAKEAKKFANIRHPNVVGLRGKGPPLTWAQRLKIAVDIARGLNYLHFDRAIPHGNLKATNILLDGVDLNARVADYCLHRLMTQAGTVEQILDAGVLGYRAPELAASKRPLPSFKSDMYAFGVILLELLTGKCAGDVVSGEDGGGVDLNDWVRLKVAEGHGPDCFDAVLITEMGTPAADKGMKEVLGIALRCIRPLSERPGIKTVYEDLSSI